MTRARQSNLTSYERETAERFYPWVSRIVEALSNVDRAELSLWLVERAASRKAA